MDHFHVPGLAVAVFDATTIDALAFGHASLDPPIPTTPGTIFDCASTSKSLTAAAVGKLTEQHPHISWATSVTALSPGIFVLPSADITLEDILSHRSGMPRHDESCLGVHSATPDTPRSVTANLQRLVTSAAPRTRFQYCNLMYTAASHVVEAVSGVPFAEFLRENFFAPLGMHDTHVQPSAVLAAGLEARFAVPYAWDDDEDGDDSSDKEREEKGRYRSLARLEQPEGQGAGSVQSTVRDFARWAQAVMVRGQAGASGEGVLSERTFAALVAPRVVVEPSATEEGDEERLAPLTSHRLYALGWEVESYRGRRIVRHDGCVNGFGSLVLFLPALQFGLVVFGNATRAADLAPVLAMEVVDVALGVRDERVDWLAWVEGGGGEGERGGEAEGGAVAKDPERGWYRNAGYHDVVVEVRDGELFIDATDRSMPFWINFEHLAEDRKFVAHLKDDEGEFALLAAEFRLDEAGEVCSLGIAFVQEMDNYLVWFERTEEPT
ncbi:Beta-lactamase family protein [Mycena venus]|uniref:Beta-lactamase family protein n=1 Tax=Mycena venus TaxID=2733690 RepID=A0A8H7CD01_9AGAR|nr:Beta-lactamase family protein [Mycena venus]